MEAPVAAARASGVVGLMSWLRGIAAKGLGLVLDKDDAVRVADVEGELEFGSRVMFLCSSMLRRGREKHFIRIVITQQKMGNKTTTKKKKTTNKPEKTTSQWLRKNLISHLPKFQNNYALLAVKKCFKNIFFRAL